MNERAPELRSTCCSPRCTRRSPKGAVRYVDATDHVSLELMGQHPVALANAIEALARRWGDTAEVEVEILAPPEVLRASSAEARQVLGRRLRALQAKDLDIQSRPDVGPEP